MLGQLAEQSIQNSGKRREHRLWGWAVWVSSPDPPLDSYVTSGTLRDCSVSVFSTVKRVPLYLRQKVVVLVTYYSVTKRPSRLIISQDPVGQVLGQGLAVGDFAPHSVT